MGRGERVDYREELRKAEERLKQGEAVSAVLICGRVLETALREIYHELLPRLTPEEIEGVTQALKKQGKGKQVDEFTLGQLVGLFREARLTRPAAEKLGRDLSLLENHQLVQGWVELRNRAAHGKEDIPPEDAENFYQNLKMLLQKARLVTPLKPVTGELPAWWEVVKPHPDVLEGRLVSARFAAKLDDVVADRAGKEYQDPQEFARRTYLTRGLLSLLHTLRSRLSGQGGEAVVHLQTTFGGGKTHALIALYHYVHSPGTLEREFGLYFGEAGGDPFPGARVAVFVGTAPDSLAGRTPWGEIAHQLGRYDLVREHDQRRISPGKDILRKVLGEGPVLILIDEIAEYIARCIHPKELEKSGSNIEAARAYQAQVFSFIHELTELAGSLPRCMVVITTTTSTPYGEEGERVQERLASIVGRMHKMAEPVYGEEIYEVVRRRLFSELGDPAIHEAIAERYVQMYRKLGEEVPEEVRSPRYRDHMVKAYPFHPELIDVLYNQWGSFHEFQRTRGVLRFLAEVVAWQWRHRQSLQPMPLIRISDVPLEEASIREALIQPIGRAYDSVLASDIAGGRGLASQVDERLPEEVRKHRPAKGLATAIFLYSFSGAQKEERGVTLPRLRAALLKPGLSPSTIGDMLQRLEGELLYLHKRNGRYYFSTELNLNRAVREAEDAIDRERIREEIKRFLEQGVGRDWLYVKIWPSDPGEIPDQRRHTLVLLPPERAYGDPETEEFVERTFKFVGGMPRSAPGALLVVAPDREEVTTLKGVVRQLLALREVERRRAKELSEEDQKELKHRIERKTVQAKEKVVAAWCHLALWRGQGRPEWLDLEPSLRPGFTLSNIVTERLEGRGWFTKKLSPEKLKEWIEGQKERAYSDVLNMFFSIPGMPIISERTLRDAIREGVEMGLFGLKTGDEVCWKRAVPDAFIEPESVILLEPPPTSAEAEERAEVEEVQLGVEGKGRRAEEVEGRTHYRLRVRIPWDRLSDFQRGVVLPLKDVCERVELEITVDAEAEHGIPEGVLEQKIHETLRQLGVEPHEESS